MDELRDTVMNTMLHGGVHRVWDYTKTNISPKHNLFTDHDGRIYVKYEWPPIETTDKYKITYTYSIEDDDVPDVEEQEIDQILGPYKEKSKG